MDVMYFKEAVLPSIALFFTVIGGFFTIFIYFRNSQLRRAEWLYSLFEKFFYEDKYSEIRKLIDYENKDDIEHLINCINHKENTDLEEKLVNYLNFFEFIADLWLLKQVPLKEIEMMFKYYILRIGDHAFINVYLEKNGFEGLPKLIRKIKHG